MNVCVAPIAQSSHTVDLFLLWNSSRQWMHLHVCLVLGFCIRSCFLTIRTVGTHYGPLIPIELIVTVTTDAEIFSRCPCTFLRAFVKLAEFSQKWEYMDVTTAEIPTTTLALFCRSLFTRTKCRQPAFTWMFAHCNSNKRKAAGFGPVHLTQGSSNDGTAFVVVSNPSVK